MHGPTRDAQIRDASLMAAARCLVDASVDGCPFPLVCTRTLERGAACMLTSSRSTWQPLHSRELPGVRLPVYQAVTQLCEQPEAHSPIEGVRRLHW